MWNKLRRLHGGVKVREISSLFRDKGRAEGFSLTLDGLVFDYSKTSIDAAIRRALIALARQSGVEDKRDAMLRGDPINGTERRAVLHTTSRAIHTGLDDLHVDGHDVMAETRATHARMVAFCNAVRSGRWPENGARITDVVNIGIGGSDLGPVMACRALKPYADGPQCHFVSNLDSADIHDTLRGLDPRSTLVVVSSKSFTTLETLMNARVARGWMEAGGSAGAMDRFVAISSAPEKTAEFGIRPEQVFGFGSWIGGRYSVWSPIGLSLMLAIGPERFDAFLQGGHAMDRHFSEAPLEVNMPVLLALVGLWHQKICGFPTRAVVPYEHRLARLPAYLQQLEMESNGKNVSLDGSPLEHGGGPVVWGEPGTNGQHAFFQLIHQGRDIVPCEFLVGAEGHEPDLAEHHDALVANCLAQSEALLMGRSLEQARKQLEDKGYSEECVAEIAPHRVFSGERPSTTLLYPKMTPFVLGQIIALYEHRVFVEGVILGLNSFDQWGVELGKELAEAFVPAVAGGALPENTSDSTALLVERLRSLKS